MTWKEFKKLLESNGVKDTDEIQYIDVDSVLATPKRVSILRNKQDDGSVELSVS